ncbi:MAG: CBM20 domain-containing protein [Clostridia bacterium]|nr:CBM20 domain-containing protein [Clostridia bacterium]
MGQNVYVAGNCAELGNWAAASAAGPGTCPNYPTWKVTVNLTRGQVIQFKAIKKDANGNTIWEGGSNKTYTVPTTGTSGSYTWTWVN